MKRSIITIILSLMLATQAFAGRVLPQNMQMAIFQSIDYPHVTLSNAGFSWLKLLTAGWLDGTQEFTLSPAVTVKNTNNLFIVYNELSKYKGQAVAVLQDPKTQQITSIWILTPQEQAVFKQRAALLHK